MSDALSSILGGTTVGRAIVELVGDNSKLKKDLTEAQTSTTASTSKMSKVWQHFGVVAQTAALAAGAALVKFGVDSVRAFQEAELANIKLQNSLLNNPLAASTSIDSYRAQADELRRLTGVSDEAVQGSQAMLAQFGLTGDQVQQLVPLIVDLSTKMGIDLNAATKAVGKATQGSAGILSRYGITLDETALKADAFGAVMDGLSQKVGGFAEQEAATLDGQMRILGQAFDEFKEGIGGQVVPALTAIAGLANDVAGSADSGASGMENLGRAAVMAVPGLQGLAAASALLGRDEQQMSGALDAGIDSMGQWTQQLQDNSITTDEYRGRVRTLVDDLRDMGVSEATLQQILAASESTIDAHAEGILGVGTAAEESARDIRAFALANLALGDGFLGIRGAALSAKNAQRDYADAQAEVNRLARSGKKGTAEYREAVLEREDAELGAVESQLGLASAVAKYIDEQKKGEPTQRQTAQLVREYGRMAGLSRDDTNDLIGTVQDLIGKYKQVPGSKKTNVSAPGAEKAAADVREYVRWLHLIPSTISTQLQYRRVDVGAPGGPSPIAEGGIIAGARGFITRGPTYLVGEGTRQTFAGVGAEAVLPLDQRGIGILAEALRQANRQTGDPSLTSRGPAQIRQPLYVSIEVDGKVLAKSVTLHQEHNRIVLGGRR